MGKVFEEIDQAEESSQALAHKEQYQRALEEWRAWRKRNVEKLQRLREELGKEEVKTTPAEKEATEQVQEWIEEVLEEVEEEIID